MEFDIEKEMAKMRRARSIHCPYCDHKQDNETMYQHVTYWGMEGGESSKKCWCESCGKVFYVEEHVERTFISSIGDKDLT